MKKLKVNNYLILLIFVLLFSQAGLIYILFQNESESNIYSSDQQVMDLPVHRSYFINKDFYDEAYEQASLQIKIPEDMVYGGIIPHHLLVKDKLAAFFESLKDNQYKTIILIGPNHFNNGKSNVITSQAKWITPYGYLEPNLELIDKLISNKEVNLEEEPFNVEHSISGLVSFIKKSFPQVNFVPIILKNNTTVAEAAKLAEIINNNSNSKNTLVLASVDFSHYLPTAVADFHDIKSNDVIQEFDFNRIYSLEVDSPSSIYAVLKYLDLNNFKESDLVFSTNSGKLIGREDEPTTSHSFFYFQEGAEIKTSLVNYLFFGDLMLDRHVKEKIQNDDLGYLLDELAGEEKRFFQGVDLIGANLEGAVTNSGQHYPPGFLYDFAFSPEVINSLKDYNFNFFNLANNHLTDQGQIGVDETRKNLSGLGFNYSGCSDGQIDDCSSWIVEVADYKIGTAGFSMVYSKLNQEDLKNEIEELAEESDYIIVNIHWGEEYQHQFNKSQQEIAHALIDAGADLIIGHHPHVVQGMEVYNGKPIFYSLGNFIFDQYFSPATQEGLSVGLSLLFNNETEGVTDYQLNLFPFKSRLSQVELMDQSEQDKFFQDFIQWSEIDEQYQEQIKEGELKVS